MKIKYLQRNDAEVFSHDLEKKMRVACCDCGLVHDIAMGVDGESLTIVASRNKRATAGLRGRKEHPLVDEPSRKLQAVYAWIEANQYDGKWANAENDEIVRHELVNALAAELEAIE